MKKLKIYVDTSVIGYQMIEIYSPMEVIELCQKRKHLIA